MVARGVGLAADIAAFVEEHRGCPELDGGVEGGWVRLRCGCGAELLWQADED